MATTGDFPPRSVTQEEVKEIANRLRLGVEEGMISPDQADQQFQGYLRSLRLSAPSDFYQFQNSTSYALSTTYLPSTYLPSIDWGLRDTTGIPNVVQTVSTTGGDVAFAPIPPGKTAGSAEIQQLIGQMLGGATGMQPQPIKLAPDTSGLDRALARAAELAYTERITSGFLAASYGETVVKEMPEPEPEPEVAPEPPEKPWPSLPNILQRKVFRPGTRAI